MTKHYDYELVYNYILDLIYHELSEHDKIPSENTLCQKFNLSRLTIRQGILKLKSEGYLYSRQGSGNFVSPKKITYNISPHTTFSNEMKKLNKEHQVKLISKNIIKADDEIAAKLGIREAENVLFLKNIRLVEGVPFLYAEYYLNLSVLKDVDKYIDEINSFSKLYTQTYALKPIRDNSEINITSINYHLKKQFQIQNDMPLIKISTKTMDKNSNQTIDYCESYFRSDMAKIVVNYKEY